MIQPDVSGDIFIESWFYQSNFSMYNLHSHEHYEMYYLISGKRKYMVKDKIFEVYPGDLVLIKPDVLHMTMPLDSNPHERIVFNITEKILNKFPLHKDKFKELFNVNLIRTNPETSEKIKEILEKINEEYVNKDELSDEMMIHLTFEFFTTVYRAKNNYKTEDILCPKTKDDKINLALKYIYTNYQNKITLDEIANLCHVNSSYFSRLFKNSTGINFITYVNNLKIREATKLLTETNMSILEISDTCGFESPQRFCDTFKKIKGVSASVYRENNKKNI